MYLHNVHHLYRLFMHYTAIYVIFKAWIVGV